MVMRVHSIDVIVEDGEPNPAHGVRICLEMMGWALVINYLEKKVIQYTFYYAALCPVYRTA